MRGEADSTHYMQMFQLTLPTTVTLVQPFEAHVLHRRVHQDNAGQAICGTLQVVQRLHRLPLPTARLLASVLHTWIIAGLYGL